MTQQTTMAAELEAEIKRVAAAVQQAKWRRSNDLERLVRRLGALQAAQQRYRQQYDHLAAPVAQLEDELTTATRRLEQARAALREAQRAHDALGPKLEAARVALATVQPLWPAEEKYPPPDRYYRDTLTGQVHYFVGDREVCQDGSPVLAECKIG